MDKDGKEVELDDDDEDDDDDEEGKELGGNAFFVLNYEIKMMMRMMKKN